MTGNRIVPKFTLFDRISIMFDLWVNDVDGPEFSEVRICEDIVDAVSQGWEFEEITNVANMIGNQNAVSPEWHSFYGVLTKCLNTVFFKSNAALN